MKRAILVPSVMACLWFVVHVWGQPIVVGALLYLYNNVMFSCY